VFQFSLKAPLTSKMSSKQHLLLGLLSLFLRPLEALPAFNASSNKIEVGEYGTKQTVKCFDQFNGYGNSLTLKYPVSDLWTYNWDNKISSCCFTGFWLMYEYRDYNQFNSNGMVYYGYGLDHCRNMNDGYPSFNNKASSIRSVGALEGYKYDSLTLYEKSTFAGYELKSFGSQWIIDQSYFGRSAAITGCTAWTLYSNVNFGGSCVCLYPSDQNNCEVGLYKNLPLNIQNSVASVRRGCYCNYHKYPNA